MKLGKLKSQLELVACHLDDLMAQLENKKGTEVTVLILRMSDLRQHISDMIGREIEEKFVKPYA